MFEFDLDREASLMAVSMNSGSKQEQAAQKPKSIMSRSRIWLAAVVVGVVCVVIIANELGASTTRIIDFAESRVLFIFRLAIYVGLFLSWERLVANFAQASPSPRALRSSKRSLLTLFAVYELVFAFNIGSLFLGR